MERLLVIDDNLDLLEGLTLLLEDAGFTVRALRSGAEAPAALESFRPDCLLLDLRMPGCTGVQVLSRLGADSPPVIVMTASEELACQARRYRPFGLLEKPFDFDRLVSLAREACRSHAAQSTPAS